MSIARDLEIGGEYEFHAVGPSQRLRETLTAVAFAFAMALVAIYMILGAQFNSFVHPFTIMLSAPLSFVGAFAAVFLFGHSLDVMGQIAFLMLMGIVMKNGILLVDYTNTLRDRGLPLRPRRHPQMLDDLDLPRFRPDLLLRHSLHLGRMASPTPASHSHRTGCQTRTRLTCLHSERTSSIPDVNIRLSVIEA